MARSIEIDDEVYAWLKRQADPFEDTPNSVLRRIAGIASNGQTTPPGTVPLASQTATQLRVRPQVAPPSGPGRRKLNAQALQNLGVSHFLVDDDIPDYLGKRAHPRAYLDAMLDAGKTTVPYFERWNEEGRPNPRGDAASRVILKIGLHDEASIVCFRDGRQVKMSDFVRQFLA